MRGRHFSSLEELPTDGTRAIRHMNKSGVLDGITMFPERWDSVIEKQGDYIEGLCTVNLKEINSLVKNIMCITFEMAFICINWFIYSRFDCEVFSLLSSVGE